MKRLQVRMLGQGSIVTLVAVLDTILRDTRTVTSAAADGLPPLMRSVAPLVDESREVVQGLRESWPLRTLLPTWSAGPPGQDLVPLRLAGALHALALSGRHPELAAAYPPAAAAFDAATLAPRLRQLLVAEADHVRAYLANAPQTNEVMRSAVLIGGYAAIAEATKLPLALREIGSSAGLNLLWDRFHYALGAQTWGDAASPVRIASDWRGQPPTLPARIAVAERRGNDLRPIALSDPAAVLRAPDAVVAAGRDVTEADFLQPGAAQVAAGYAIYGPTTMFVLTVAAAEAAVGLAILVVYFRNRGEIAVEDVNVLRG